MSCASLDLTCLCLEFLFPRLIHYTFLLRNTNLCSPLNYCFIHSLRPHIVLNTVDVSEIEVFGYVIEEERFPSAAPSATKPILPNLALASNNATATQSSDQGSNVANGAIDGINYGNRSVSLQTGEYSKTDLESAPWWRVELPSLSELREIKLHTSGKYPMPVSGIKHRTIAKRLQA